MGQILESLKDALLKRQETESLRAIGLAAGVDHALLSHIINGTRDGVSMATAQKLADYLGLELRPKPRKK